MPPPKVAPMALASGIMAALKEGIEQSFIGDIARDIAERWRDDPGQLERELTLTKNLE